MWIHYKLHKQYATASTGSTGGFGSQVDGWHWSYAATTLDSQFELVSRLVSPNRRNRRQSANRSNQSLSSSSISYDTHTTQYYIPAYRKLTLGQDIASNSQTPSTPREEAWMVGLVRPHASLHYTIGSIFIAGSSARLFINKGNLVRSSSPFWPIESRGTIA